jgi:hypothetical protein
MQSDSWEGKTGMRGEGVVSSWFQERLFQIQKSETLPKIIGKKAYKSVRSSHSDTWQDSLNGAAT